MSEAALEKADDQIKLIVDRLKVRRVFERGLQTGPIKKRLAQANQDITFLLGLTSLLAKKTAEAISALPQNEGATGEPQEPQKEAFTGEPQIPEPL